MKVFRLNGLILMPGETEERLAAKAAAALHIRAADLVTLSVIRKALDARRNRPPHFVYAVKIVLCDDAVLPETLPDGIQLQSCHDEKKMDKASVRPSGSLSRKLPVIVVGGGPAGIFAAYTLAVGEMPVLLIERGRPVEKRVADVESFWKKGVLDAQSNVLFGEGGAGTFSDGKLTSRSKNPYSGLVKKILVDLGAPSSILTDAKPHIGTDRLRKVLVNMRRKLQEAGCDIRFETQVTDFIVRRGAITAVTVNGKEEIKTDRVVLAVGQSADDTYRMIHQHGIEMEPKPFAMGVRVEHPQALINKIQYGRWSDHPHLPPAEYFITAAVRELNRSVYTFCMCPGGQVIGCSAFPQTLITNGMSNADRDGEFANSAVVVNVRVEDFAVTGDPLSGLDFRSRWEKEAYLAGGGNYGAPAQRLSEFLGRKSSGVVGRTSFLPGVQAARLENILPDFVSAALRAGIRQFDKKMTGFISDDAHLIGVETRTSSPVRICRNTNGESDTIRGFYPCGEGSGYSGGIISSALDGIRAAHCLMAASDGCR